jgi:hypothetical protein
VNSQWSLDRFLEPDPRDAGCARTADLLDVYVELMLAGAEPAERYPGVAAHLADCDACHQDFTGLLEAVRGNSHGS